MTPSNDVLVRFATEGHGSYRGATGSDIYFENIMQVPIYYLPRLSVRHGRDGIARIKNILKYYILMSEVLYISNDKSWAQNVHIYLIDYVNYIPI